MKLLLNRRGQGLVEYLIIVALMAIATMAVMRVMSQNVSARFANIAQAIQGRPATVSVTTEAITEQHIKKKDMSDFFNGAHSNGQNNQD